TSQLSYTPYISAPVSTPEPTPEQTNYISSNLSVVGDFQQELAKRKLSTIEPSDSSDSRDYENNSEPSKNPYSRANKASKRAKDPSTIKDTPATSRPSSPLTARSTLKYSRARTILSSEPPKQEAARTSTRAATAVYKKRLRLSPGTSDHQDENTPYNIAQPYQKRKKRRPSIRPLSDPSKYSAASSLHGGYPPIETHIHVGREYTARTAKGKRGNIMVETYHPFKFTIQPNYATKPALGLEDRRNANKRGYAIRIFLGSRLSTLRYTQHPP
ncbi:hypothetical protein N7527_009034, partial [Penicillium freii]